MPIYVYKCPECGYFEAQFSMSAVRQSVRCPDCGRAARKVVTTPHLARTPVALARQRERAEASRESPEVVPAVPAEAPRRARPAWNPKWASLPRP
jgi:putative FmdB family regulatory protein